MKIRELVDYCVDRDILDWEIAVEIETEDGITQGLVGAIEPTDINLYFYNREYAVPALWLSAIDGEHYPHKEKEGEETW